MDKMGLWGPVPRFGVKQGDSVRAVDDHTFAGQNGATSIAEKVNTGGVDVVVGIARCLLLAEPGGDCNIQLSTGEVASTTIHHDWTKEGFGGGLSMVYRQLARCPAHAALTVVASWCGRSQTTKLYEQPVLAFGATLSVMSFCLVARALWHVAVVLAQITWTHFADDFPCVAFRQVAPELESFIDGFFDLFGWRVKDLARFALSFPALGVVFTFPAEDRTVVVANTQSRMQSLSDSVSGISGPTLLTNKVATTLRCKTAICPYPGIRQMRRSRFPLAGSGRRRTELFSERRVRRVARIAFLGQGTARHPHSA